MSAIYPTSSPLTPPILGVKVNSKGKIDLHVSSEKYQNMEIAKIVEHSKEYLVQARQDLDHSKEITNGGLRKIEQQSSDIIHYTDLIIQAKQAQREASRFERMIALVFCAIGSVALIGIPFLILLRRNDQAFKKEMQALQNNVQVMRQEREEILGTYEELLRSSDLNIPEELIPKIARLKGSSAQLMDRLDDLNLQIKEIASQKPVDEQRLNELKNEQSEIRGLLVSYLNSVLMMMDSGLSFEQAVEYINHLEYLRSAEVAEGIKKSINATFTDQLSQASERFESDIERGATFELNGILYPIPEDQAKTRKAAEAIESLVDEGDEEWLPILQLAVTQTNLNGAFGRPLIALATHEGNLISWKEESDEYALQSEFPGRKMPPTRLEVVRNPTGRITEVQVSLDGGLNLVKKKMNNPTTQSGEDEPTDTVIIQDAFSASLSYTLTLKDGKPNIDKFEYVCRANLR